MYAPAGHVGLTQRTGLMSPPAQYSYIVHPLHCSFRLFPVQTKDVFHVYP